MITKVEAFNYRCLKNIAQGLESFHVVAGPNGSGKSAFFDVIRVLGAFADDGLNAVWEESRAKRFAELLSFGEGTSFQLAVELKLPDALPERLGRNGSDSKQLLRYEVEIGYDSGDDSGEARILAENLWLIDKPTSSARPDVVQMEMQFPSAPKPHRSLIHGQHRAGWRKVAAKTGKLNAYFRSETSNWNFQLKNGPVRSTMSSLPEDERFGFANWAKSVLTRGVQKLMLRSELMQQPCGPLKERRFAPDGSTLPLVVRELHKNKKSYDGWLAHVRTILPIQDIETIEREEDKHCYLRVTYAAGVQVPSWHLSDGTLRMLALTLLPYISSDVLLYLIEEPENGVHPRAVEAIYQSLSSLYDGQVIVATHSPVLVGLIEPCQLLCFSRTDKGETDIVRGDQHPMLKPWQKDFKLAQLFAAGVLG